MGAQWLATAPAAVSPAGRTDPTATVWTQGHRIRVVDFLSTLIVEATIHSWDLSLDLLDEFEAPEAAMSVTRDVLGRLVGAELPQAWDDEMVLVKTTGRHPLLDEEEQRLGQAVERIPVIR